LRLGPLFGELVGGLALGHLARRRPAVAFEHVKPLSVVALPIRAFGFHPVAARPAHVRPVAPLAHHPLKTKLGAPGEERLAVGKGLDLGEIGYARPLAELREIPFALG